MRLSKTRLYLIATGLVLFAGGIPTAQAPAPASTSTAGIDESLLAGLRWRSVGPARGGRSQAVAGSTKRPTEYYFGATGGGLWKTTDGGKTWTEATTNPGLPKPLWGKIGISVSGADSNRVYALIEAQDGGLYASDDAGATWKLVNDNRNIRQRAFYYTRVYADPQAKDTV